MQLILGCFLVIGVVAVRKDNKLTEDFVVKISPPNWVKDYQEESQAVEKMKRLQKEVKRIEKVLENSTKS
jgi:hypothetical protein